MKLFEDIIVVEIRALFVLKFFYVGSCTESLLHFTQKNNGFYIIRSLILNNFIANGLLHFGRESIEILFTIHVNIANSVLNFGLDFVESETGEKRSEALVGDLHKDICKFVYKVIR